MTGRLRALARPLAVLASAAALAAQQGAPVEAPQATFRTGIDFVVVDVIVSDDGEPVTDLRAEDFTILEDGAPQVVEQFRLVEVRNGAGGPPPGPIRNADDERREAARDDARVFVFFLDDYHTEFGNAVTARNALIEFVQTRVGPNDLMAVMGPLTPLDAVRLTRDRAAIVRQIEGFEGRRFRYDPRNAYEEAYLQYPAAVIEALRNQVVIGALRGLSVHLGALREGRKAIIYVSEGMSGTLPAGIRNMMSGADARGEGSSFAGTGPGIADTQRAFGQSELYNRLREVSDDANRNNTAIYTVDPRGLGGGFMFDQNVNRNDGEAYLADARTVLRVIAERTDGRAIVNRNDLAEGLTQVLRDSSAYYLIGFTSSLPPDGAFHELEVRVNRPGVRVRARPGYRAATAADVRRVEAPARAVPEAVTNALAEIAAPVQAARYVRLWIGATRGEGGRTRVSLVWEPLDAVPGAARERAGQLMVTAVSASQDLLFRGRTPAEGGGAGPFLVAFDADPGPIELDIAVEGETGGRLDTDIRTFAVPDLSPGRAVVSAPRVFRARTAREFREIAADAAAVPTPSREFRRSERLLIRFDAWSADGAPAGPVATLLNRAGEPLAEVPVAPAEAGGTHQVDLGFGSLPPGDYLLQIAVPGVEAPTLVPLRVGG